MCGQRRKRHAAGHVMRAGEAGLGKRRLALETTTRHAWGWSELQQLVTTCLAGEGTSWSLKETCQACSGMERTTVADEDVLRWRKKQLEVTGKGKEPAGTVANSKKQCAMRLLHPGVGSVRKMAMQAHGS